MLDAESFIFLRVTVTPTFDWRLSKSVKRPLIYEVENCCDFIKWGARKKPVNLNMHDEWMRDKVVFFGSIGRSTMKGGILNTFQKAKVGPQ